MRADTTYEQRGERESFKDEERERERGLLEPGFLAFWNRGLLKIAWDRELWGFQRTRE